MSDTTERLKLVLDPSGIRPGAQEGARSLAEIVAASRSAQTELDRTAVVARGTGQALASAAKLAAAAWAGLEIGKTGREILQLAARYETLGVVVRTVGASVGGSAAQLNGLESALQRTGISMIQARQNIARMVQAQLDLTNATQLARVAQDAAVIANTNSSEAFERLVYGISAGQTRVLRTLGILVSFESAYAKFAEAANRTTDSLTEEEKVQIRASAAMEAGARIAGAYEASMQTAGKQILSAQRYLEDLKVTLGTSFQPAYTAAVFGYANGLKALRDNANLVIGAFAALGTFAGARFLAPLVQTIAKGAAAFGEMTRATITTTAAQRAQARVTYETASANARNAALAVTEAQERVQGLRLEIEMRKQNLIAIGEEEVAIARRQGVDVRGALGGNAVTADAVNRNATLRATQQLAIAERELAAATLAMTGAQAAASTALRQTGLASAFAATAANAFNKSLLFLANNGVMVGLVTLSFVIGKVASQQTEASKVAGLYADRMNEVRARLQGATEAAASLTREQQTARLAALTAKMEELKERTEEVKDALGEAQKWMDWSRLGVGLTAAGRDFKLTADEIREAAQTGKISLDEYVKQIDALILKYPQFAKIGGELRETGIAAATVADEYKRAKTEAEALGRALADTSTYVNGATIALEHQAQRLADLKAGLDGLNALVRKAAETQQTLTVTQTKGAAAGRTYAMALEAWNEQQTKAINEGKKTSPFVVSFSEALRQNGTAAADLARNYLAAAGAVTKTQDALDKAQNPTKASETAAKKLAAAMKETTDEIQRAADAAFDLAAGRTATVGDLAREVQEARDRLAALKESRLEYERLIDVQATEAEVRRLSNGLTDEQITKVRQLVFELRQLRKQEEEGLKDPNRGVPLTPLVPSSTSDAGRKGLRDAYETGALLRENLARGLQSAGADFFRDLLTEGFKSFASFAESIKELLVRTFAELASRKLLASLFDRAGGGDPSGAFRPGGSINPRQQRTAFGGLGSPAGGRREAFTNALGAAGAGLAIGSLAGSTGNKTLGVLGGAGGGAAAGAQIGGAWGALIGGVAGAVSGFFSASAKAKEAARQMREAQKEFGRSLDAFRETVRGSSNDLANALRQSQQTVQDLLKQADAAYSGKKNERTRNAKRAEIEQLGRENAARLKREFEADLDAQIATLKGNEALVRRADIERQYTANLEAARIAGIDTAKATELYELQLKKLDEEMAQAAERARQTAEAFASNLTARRARLNGDERGAYSEELAQQQRDEINRAKELLQAGTITQEAFEALTKLLGEEFADAMRRFDEQAAAAKANTLDGLRARQLEAQGRSEEAAALRQQIEDRNELLGVTDEAIRAEILRTQAIEAAARAAELAAQKERQRSDFALDLLERRAELSGSPEDRRRALEAKLANQRKAELEAAQKLVDQGIITQEMFEELARILGDEMVKALADLERAVESAKQSFAEDMELRRLAVLERVGGQDVSDRRRQIERDRELRQAREQGRSAEEIQQLIFVQELEELAFTFERETNRQLAALDEQTEVARAALAAAQQQAAEYARQAAASREAAASLREFVGKQRLATATPEQLLQANKAAYERALASGDANELQNAASAYLQSAQDYFGSTEEFQRIAGEVLGRVEQSARGYEAQADGFEAMAAAASEQALALAALVATLEAQRRDLEVTRQKEFELRVRELEERQLQREQSAAANTEPPRIKVEIDELPIPKVELPSLEEDLAPLVSRMTEVTEAVDAVAKVTTASGLTIERRLTDVVSAIGGLGSRIAMLAAAVRASKE